jgi:hypothetical protein
MQLVAQGSDKEDSLYYVFTRSIQNSGVMLSVGKVAVDRDSSVGIATGYGLDGPGIESRWGRDFPCFSLGSTQPPIQWVPRLSRG